MFMNYHDLYTWRETKFIFNYFYDNNYVKSSSDEDDEESSDRISVSSVLYTIHNDAKIHEVDHLLYCSAKQLRRINLEALHV